MKSLVLAVAVGLLAGCAQTIPQELKAFDTYCVKAHIRYEAWSTRGEVWITAWPESGKWYVPDGFLSGWREYQAGYWIESAPTLKEAVDHVLKDIQTSRPRLSQNELGDLVDIGAR